MCGQNKTAIVCGHIVEDPCEIVNQLVKMYICCSRAYKHFKKTVKGVQIKTVFIKWWFLMEFGVKFVCFSQLTMDAHEKEVKMRRVFV